MAGPLSHLRVLDLSRVLAGPWASQMLADLGAEVIKIERPGAGDDTRAWGPPWARDENGDATDIAAYFLAANRGKQSLAVDIAKPEGAGLIRDLAARCDVVLENFKVGDLARYGLDYAALSAIRPDLVYCSITGFGQDGPYAAKAGYDLLIQGMGGLMSLTGEAEGEPMKTGVAIIDVFTGLYSTIAILGALAHRDRTGQGQHVDMALLDVSVAILANQASNYLAGGVVPKRRGNAHPSIVPYQVFATANGHMILAVGNDGQFTRFCAQAGRPDLALDIRFATNAARVANRDALLAEIRPILASRTTGQWVDLLDGAGVPAGPINTLDQVFADPQVRHRGMAVTLPHPKAGAVTVVGNPIKYSATPIVHDRAPPALGEATGRVLTEVLGLDDDTVTALRAKGVVG